jgi:hypothetical protein
VFSYNFGLLRALRALAKSSFLKLNKAVSSLKIGVKIGENQGARSRLSRVTNLETAPFTHAKISHIVTSLSTSRQQVVFALLVSSCQQAWNKLLKICNNLVDIIRSTCYKVVPTSPIQS